MPADRPYGRYAMHMTQARIFDALNPFVDENKQTV
jgi:hypothetical protein